MYKRQLTPGGKSGGGIRLGKLTKIFGVTYNISATAGANDFKFGAQLGFSKAHHKIARRRKVSVAWARGASRIWGFPFNKPAMTEGSDFKIGNLVGFAKVHHKILPRRKRVRGPGLGEHLKILGFSFNIYAMAERIDFKFCTQFLWPIRPIIKSHE